jgi:hypothetical protein
MRLSLPTTRAGDLVVLRDELADNKNTLYLSNFAAVCAPSQELGTLSGAVAVFAATGYCDRCQAASNS